MIWQINCQYWEWKGSKLLIYMLSIKVAELWVILVGQYKDWINLYSKQVYKIILYFDADSFLRGISSDPFIKLWYNN